MKITIDKNDFTKDIIISSNFVLNKVCNKIKKILIDNNVSYIVTNGNIASLLQDSTYYTLSNSSLLNSSISNGEPYYVGKFYDKNLMIDPHLRWDDNRIFLKYDKTIMTTYKIKRILKKEYIDFLDEIYIDEYIVNLMI